MKDVLLVLLVFTGSISAQESITLTAPIPAINAYVPGSLFIQLLPNPSIAIIIVHVASGRQERFVYPCDMPCAMDTEAKVTTMITALNTANLSTRSLWRRIFDRLLLDFPTRFIGATVQ